MSFQFECFTTAGRPAASALTVGRAIFDTDLERLFIDAGGNWVSTSVYRYVYTDESTWDGDALTHAYVVDGSVHLDGQEGFVPDARFAVWVLRSVATGKDVPCSIVVTASTVTVTVDAPALDAGFYTLIGVG